MLAGWRATRRSRSSTPITSYGGAPTQAGSPIVETLYRSARNGRISGTDPLGKAARWPTAHGTSASYDSRRPDADDRATFARSEASMLRPNPSRPLGGTLAPS